MPSAAANYYLTGRIYIVRSVGVERYHIRLPSGVQSTRDHRIERVTTGDRRAQLRTALPRLPATAPNYFVFCAAQVGNWQLQEVGYCGGDALLQASSMNVQGYLTEIGLETDRLGRSLVTLGEGQSLAAIIKEVKARLKALGESRLKNMG